MKLTLLNRVPGSKPNSWGKLSDRIQEAELKPRFVLITSCSNNHQEIRHPGMPVWLQYVSVTSLGMACAGWLGPLGSIDSNKREGCRVGLG